MHFHSSRITLLINLRTQHVVFQLCRCTCCCFASPSVWKTPMCSSQSSPDVISSGKPSLTSIPISPLFPYNLFFSLLYTYSHYCIYLNNSARICMNYIASYPKPGETNECKSYNHITTYTKTRKQRGKEKKAKTR